MNQVSRKGFNASFRKRMFSLAAVGTLTLFGGVTFAQATLNRFPITPDQVIAIISARQLPVNGVQIKISAPITSSSPNPMLEIENLTKTGELGVQLRVACPAKHECLPFYVSATWPSNAGPDLADALSQATLRSRVVEIGKSVKAISSERGMSIDSFMHSGTPATLLIEDQKIHIRLRVICLEDGSTGANIRVATPDRKQSYHAEVIAPNLLKGSF